MKNKSLPWAKAPLILAAAIFAVGLLLTVGPGPVAAGGSIEVVSQDTQVQFPGGVTFDVAVEGQAEIVEVKLSYRSANGGPWSYTYLDLEPSTRVETSFTLETSGGRYIPPGALVEYFYTIRDASGAVQRSGSKIVAYSDNRYRWETATIGSLTLYWHDQSPERVEAVTGQVKQSMARVEALLGVELGKGTRGVIYNSREEASLAFPRLSPTIDDGQVFHGFAFPEWDAFTGVGLSPVLITHEATHLLLDQAVGKAIARVPAWLNEGFASYMEPGARPALARALERRRPADMPLRTMTSVPGRPSHIGFFYRKAESVVGYLIETYGEGDFRGFIARLNQGQHVDAALRATYGFNQDGLEARWLGTTPHATGTEAPAQDEDGGFPMVQIESLIIGGLVVLAALVMTARALFKKLVAGSKSSDEPYTVNSSRD